MRRDIPSIIAVWAAAAAGTWAAAPAGAAAETPAGAATIVVTATPLPAPADLLGRSADIVGAGALRAMGGVSVAEALRQATGVEVQERGPGGVQSDVSIRGSTFQQVLLTLDGLPLNDPQTAHHNMDLPFPLSALDAIAVLPGPASALLGPGAFAGAIDLAPRRPARDGARAEAAAGSFGTRRAEAAADAVAPPFSATAAGNWAASDGFRDGTDYDLWSAWGSAFLEQEHLTLRVSGGHADRDFGARDFYAPFPSREKTAVTLVDIAPEARTTDGWTFRGIGRFRRHDDEFILTSEDPDFYRNRHSTEVFTERLTAVSPPHGGGTTAAGVQREDAALDSSQLGERDEAVTSAFLQHRAGGGPWSVDLGIRGDDHDRWGTEWSPSAAASLRAADPVRLRAAAARAIRPPSFTERYYVDPKNVGDPALRPEEAWNVEAGADADVAEGLAAGATYFVRRTENLIDWVRASPSDPWRAVNAGDATFQGLELSLRGRAAPLAWRAAYRHTGVDGADDVPGESKYARHVPRHDAGLGLSVGETRGAAGSVSLRYLDVPDLGARTLVSARVSRRFGAVTAFAGGTNLLDQDYEDIPGVPTPGRYLEAGAALEW